MGLCRVGHFFYVVSLPQFTVVYYTLYCTLACESNFTRKKSTCTESETRFQTALSSCTDLGEIPHFTGENANKEKHQFDTKVNTKVKAALAVEKREKWEQHVKQLAVQGQYLALAAAEKEDVVWKSSMYNLKKGTLKFSSNRPTGPI